MIKVLHEGDADSAFVVQFDTIDDLPEIFSTHMRSKTVDLFLAPGHLPGDPMKQHGYIGSRMLEREEPHGTSLTAF